MVAQRARENASAFAFCALVGGQDELVFDGHSFVVDHTGALLARAAQFEEELLVCEVDLGAPDAERRRRSGHRARIRGGAPTVDLLGTFPPPAARGAAAADARIAPLLEPLAAEIYAALVCGLRDYVAQERLRPRRARALGRHRLRARGDDRRRRARPGARSASS